MKDVQSSVISHIGYEPEKRELTVRFHNGTFHTYEDVSSEEYSNFLGAESLGKHFNENFRKKKSRRA